MKYLYEVFGQSKSSTIDGVSFVESYNTAKFEIDNVESCYKLIDKISSIPKSLNEITQTILGKDWKIINKTSENKEQEVEKIPTEILTLFEKPWVHYCFSEFVDLLITDLLISGNIFVYLVNEGRNQRSLRRLDPIYVMWHESMGWIEQHPDRGTIALDEDYLIHVKFKPDTYSPRWGKGIIGLNLKLFESTLNKIEFENNFYENGCHPSGVFSVENQGAINETKTKEEINERFAGTKNAGKPMVLSGKVTYNQIQIDPSALKMTDELAQKHKQIMAAFGLPKFLMEIGSRDTGQKYNNHSLQQEHFIKTTIIPIAQKIEMVFTDVLQRAYPTYEFRFDIHAESYSDESLFKMAQIGTITPNEHREFMSIPKVLDNPDMDKHYLPALKASEVEEPEPEPEPKKIEVDNGHPRENDWRKADYKSHPNGEVWTREELTKAINLERIRKDFVTLNKKTRNKKTKDTLKDFREFLKKTYSEIIVNVAQRAKRIDKLAETQQQAEINKLIKELYDPKENLEAFEKVTVPIYRAVGEATYANTSNILTISIPFKHDQKTTKAAEDHINLLRENGPLVMQTTAAKLEEIIRTGMSQGKLHTEIAKDIWRKFVDENNELVEEFAKIYRPGVKPKDFDEVMSKGGKLQNRAFLIAQTEVAFANKKFATVSMQNSNVVKSVMITDCDPCQICAPYQNVPVSFESASNIQNLHPGCTGTLVPAEMSAG